jgi:hypothetical protein
MGGLSRSVTNRPPIGSQVRLLVEAWTQSLARVEPSLHGEVYVSRRLVRGIICSGKCLDSGEPCAEPSAVIVSGLIAELVGHGVVP